MNKEFKLKTNEGNVLDVSVYGLENISRAACLILVHGFKGFKDWGFFPYSAERFAKCGYFVITFNFSHNGIKGNDFNVFDIDSFAKNTVSLEISELVQVINAYKNGYFSNNIYGKIGLVGHSRGGGVAILSSLVDKVDGYVVWASVVRFDRYTERQKAEWRKQGFFEVLNSRTNQMMRMDVDLLDDIESNKTCSLNIENAARNLCRPMLLIHGTEDLTVPIIEGEQIYNWSDKSITDFERIPACGHTFDIVHPFEGSNKKFELVLVKTQEIFNKVFLLN